MNSKILLEKIADEFHAAFQSIPDHGKIGFSIQLRDGQPVRVEFSGSESIRIDEQYQLNNVSNLYRIPKGDKNV